MRKILFLITVGILAFSSSAGVYRSMQFTVSDGSVYAHDVNGLVIKFDGSNINVVNSANESLSLPASGVESMRFSEETADIRDVTGDIDGSVSVYNVGGIVVGNFDSADRAIESLGSGTYILSDSKGRTFKIFINK